MSNGSDVIYSYHRATRILPIKGSGSGGRRVDRVPNIRTSTTRSLVSDCNIAQGQRRSHQHYCPDLEIGCARIVSSQTSSACRTPLLARDRMQLRLLNRQCPMLRLSVLLPRLLRTQYRRSLPFRLHQARHILDRILFRPNKSPTKYMLSTI
jgi:hypothetical protein